MTTAELESYAAELRASYPGCHLKTAPDQCELVAEISTELTVAIIERSQPHFHRATTEVYRVIKGTLLVACAGRVGCVAGRRRDHPGAWPDLSGIWAR